MYSENIYIFFKFMEILPMTYDIASVFVNVQWASFIAGAWSSLRISKTHWVDYALISNILFLLILS